MGIIRPRVDGAVKTPRAVLYKYINFKKEYADIGAVDLTSGTTYTDSEGDVWDLAGNGTATNFELMADGIKIVRSSAVAASIGFKPYRKIPGLSPLDRIIAIARITNIAATLGGSSVSFRIDRHATKNSGGFLLYNDGVNFLINPYLVSQLSPFETDVIAAHADQLLLVENAGLTFGMRRQTSATDFPEVVPNDVPIVTGTGFAGYYSAAADTTPDVDGISVSDTLCKMEVVSTGNVARGILEEFWLYRFE